MTIKITIFLKRPRPLFHEFICWGSTGFEILFLEFKVYWKIFKYKSPWQEKIIDYLKANEKIY